MSSHFNEPLFVISVAARLVKMHPQTLRKYEREGLIAPSRTQGNLRLYSDRDIERLRQVKYLVEDRGLNLAGVQMVLDITRRLREMRAFASDRNLRQEPNGGNDGYAAIKSELDRMLRSLGFIDEELISDARRRDGLGIDPIRG
jgi:MerR family transcriptional regulator, heat shock protein HspR